ncbi:hypothetical protein, partial [Flavobacterium sp.]|uniref:hypothetical protein n=1 Tax=Flavobacterium sp. TaxID=239 RepID=UPI002629E1B6
MDLFDQQGKKIGYTDKNGKTVLFSANQAPQPANTKKFESKSNAELRLVKPTKKEHDFEPFETISAWKTTKRFGFISLDARKQLDQTTKSGEEVMNGFEKWVIKVKTAVSQTTYFGIYNVRKGILSFE